MKVRIQLKQINLLENEEKIIADGNAILENNHLKYKEKDENALHFVTFEEDEVTLERKCKIWSLNNKKSIWRYGNENKNTQSRKKRVAMGC